MIVRESIHPVFSRDALRTEVHHEDEQESVDEHPKIGGLGVGEMKETKGLWKQDEQSCPNNGTTEVPQSADDDHRKHEDALIQRGGGRVEVADVGGVEGTSNGNESRGNGECLDLGEAGVLPEATGGEFILAHRKQKPAPGRAFQSPKD